MRYPEKFPTTCPACGADLTNDGDGVVVVFENAGHGWIEPNGQLTESFDYDTTTDDIERIFCASCGEHYLFDADAKDAQDEAQDTTAPINVWSHADAAMVADAVASYVARWQSDEVSYAASDFIENIESIFEAYDVPMPTFTVDDEGNEEYAYPEPRPYEDCDRPCSVECDRMTCTRDDEE